MKIALAFGPLCLSFRKSFDFANLRTDPRGLTGSELGFIRIAEELQKAGHTVILFAKARPPKTDELDEALAELTASAPAPAQDPPEQFEWKGMRLKYWDEIAGFDCDATIAVNEPDLLRGASGLRVVLFWLNDVSFCKMGFEEHVDLWVSPSAPHLEQVMTNPAWRRVEVTPEFPEGKAQFTPDPSKWIVVPLGCDPDRYPADIPKVPGRVVYCSSPDRGLHWVLQEWPRIKRAVPHASLRIFYRLQPWIDGFKDVKYFPPIERLRARALYIEEALRRMSGPEWGIEVCDSVSRERIEREMSEAEVLAYPVDTTSWSEGFSCSTLEGCAAGAVPVIFDCDALGEIYAGAAIIVDRGDIKRWSEYVITVLSESDPYARDTCRAFAARHTWQSTTSQILTAIEERLKVAA